MQGPDENLPTTPARTPAPQPGPPHDWLGADDALPMGKPANLPPATNDGKPPVWEVPAGPRPQAGGTNLRGFSIGFAIALIVLALMVLVLIVVFLTNHNGTKVAQTASNTPNPTATITPQPLTPTTTPLPPIDGTAATNVVTNYFSLIAAKNYQQAYNLRSQAYQSQHPLDDFTQSWNNTLSVTVDPSTITTSPGSDANSILVLVSYSQTMNDATTKTYQATLTVGYDSGSIRILQVTTQTITPTPTAQPSPTGTASDQPVTTPSPSSSPSPTTSPTPATTGTATPTPATK